MVATRVLRTLLVCLLLTLGVSACGSEENGDASGSDTASDPSSETSTSASSGDPAPADAPACADLWQEGAELPRPYTGCAGDDGALVEPDRLRCESGQQLVRYDDKYYGVAGGTVHGASPSLEKDRDYRAAVRTCRA